MTTPYIDPKLIFASDAPVQDKPARFDNYAKGMDETRKNDGRPTIKQFNFLQQQNDQKILYIHERGAALPYIEGFSYEENAPVVKDGVLVQKKGAEWKPVGANKASDILDESGLTQQEVNNATKTSFYPLLSNISKENISNNFTSSLNSLLLAISNLGGGTVTIPSGTYNIDASIGIIMQDNTSLLLDNGAKFEAIPNSLGSYKIISIQGVSNVSVIGGVIVGTKNKHLTPTGSYYKERKNSTSYSIGDYIYQDRWGFKVITAGVTGAAKLNVSTSTAWNVGTTHTDGTATLEVISKDGLGEWGMGFDIRSSHNISIANIEVNSCWGDGIYIGRLGNITEPLPENGGRSPFCTNLSLQNVICDDNRRQGISVISVDCLTAYNISISNTSGTAPAAAIDIEPNNPDERATNISIDGLFTQNNESRSLILYMGTPFYNVSPTYEYDNSTTNYPQETVDAINQKYRQAATNLEDIISVDINNWKSNNDGGVMSSRFAHNKYLKGRANISNISSYSNGVQPFDLGANSSQSVRFSISDASIILGGGALSNINHVRCDVSANSDPLGNFHFERCKFLLKTGTTTNYLAPIILADSAARVPYYENMSFIDCEHNYGNQYDKFLFTCLLPLLSVNFSDMYQSSTSNVFGASSNFNATYSKHTSKKLTGTTNQTINVTSLKTGIDRVFVNDIQNSSILNVSFSSAINVVGYTRSVTDGLVTFPLRTNGVLKVKVVSENTVIVTELDDLTKIQRLTRSAVLASTEFAANSTSFFNIPHDLAVSGAFAAVSSTTVPNGILLSATVVTSGTVRVSITNATSSPITWGGTISARLVGMN